MKVLKMHDQSPRGMEDLTLAQLKARFPRSWSQVIGSVLEQHGFGGREPDACYLGFPWLEGDKDGMPMVCGGNDDEDDNFFFRGLEPDDRELHIEFGPDPVRGFIGKFGFFLKADDGELAVLKGCHCGPPHDAHLSAEQRAENARREEAWRCREQGLDVLDQRLQLVSGLGHLGLFSDTSHVAWLWTASGDLVKVSVLDWIPAGTSKKVV